MPSHGPTSRGLERHEQILVAAADLVASRGFHAVGVSDIGAAAGVSGAALYRHFDTKTAVLVALFDRAIDGLIEAASVALRLSDQPDVALATLVDAHVEFALRDRAVLAVYAQQMDELPLEDRRRLRRKQRAYVELWREPLRAARAGEDPRRELARVEATFGLLNSVPNLSGSVDDETLRRELRSMALAALLAE